MKFKAICVLKVKMNFCFHFDDESSPLSLLLCLFGFCLLEQSRLMTCLNHHAYIFAILTCNASYKFM